MRAVNKLDRKLPSIYTLAISLRELRTHQSEMQMQCLKPSRITRRYRVSSIIKFP